MPFYGGFAAMIINREKKNHNIFCLKAGQRKKVKDFESLVISALWLVWLVSVPRTKQTGEGQMQVRKGRLEITASPQRHAGS